MSPALCSSRALLVAAPLGALLAGELGALREGRQLAWLRASGRSVLADLVAARIVALALVGPLAALVAAFALLGTTAFEIARIYAGLREPDAPLRWLAMAVAQGAAHLLRLPTEFRLHW